MKRIVFAAGLLLSAIASATAQTTLRVGDQKGNSQAVMEAAGVLKGVPYRIEWKGFPASASLPGKAIGAIRQSREGLAILVPRDSHVHGFEDLRGKKIATGRGSI